MNLYYFDTSIWIDLFENRDEPNFPKGKWANDLIDSIIKINGRIIYSDINLLEFYDFGYSNYEINLLFSPIKQLLIRVMATNKEKGIAKDLSSKRNIPRRDALHALIARDNGAILIATDRHFQNIKDIIKPIHPRDAFSL